jgi:transposase
MVAADTGYFKFDEIWLLQGLNIQTAISDPQKHRRLDRLTDEDRAVLEAARQAVCSEPGKILLRRRSELVERGFQHVLDCGGARRTTLRGRENIRKRYLIQAMGANLSLLMRHLVEWALRNRRSPPRRMSSAPYLVLWYSFWAPSRVP